jgi:hypothetical protein
MRNLVILFIHLIVTLARLFGPGGMPSVVAESVLIKQQLLILSRPRVRSPNLRTSDSRVATLWALIMRLARLIRAAIVLKPSTLLSLHQAMKQRFGAKAETMVQPEDLSFMMKCSITLSERYSFCSVFAGHGKVLPKQLVHRTFVKPLPMQPPLTARGDQPVDCQQFDHLMPNDSFSHFRQLLSPEVIQFQQPPDLAPQPAIAKRPRPPQFHLAQLDLNRIDLLQPQRRWSQEPGLSKRPDRATLTFTLKAVQQVLPGRFLQLIDLSQIQHRALGDLVFRHTPIFHDAVVVVNLPIFLARCASQKHGPSLPSPPTDCKGVGLHYKPLSHVFELLAFIACD